MKHPLARTHQNIKTCTQVGDDVPVRLYVLNQVEDENNSFIILIDL